jgi:hypothetical protein
MHPTPFPFVIFTLGLVVESIKELGGASKVVLWALYVETNV